MGTNDRDSHHRGDSHPNAPRDDDRRGNHQQQQRPAETTREPSQLPAEEFAKKYSITEELVEIVRKLQCPTATDVELHFFFSVCQRTKLDPFTNQIWLVKRKQSVEDSWGNRSMVEVARPQTGIDGFRVIAERTNQYDGQAKQEWCGDDGKWVDVWLAAIPPRAARCIVYRKGFREGVPAVAHWDEYVPKYGTGPNAKIAFKWQQSPAGQLSKCAEALALRKAFPNDLSGLHTDDEMERVNATESYTAPTAASRVIEAVVASQAVAAAEQKTEQKAAAALESTDMKQKAEIDLAALRVALEGCQKRPELLAAQRKHLAAYLKDPKDPFNAEILERARPVYAEHSQRVKKTEQAAAHVGPQGGPV
jgi:phage recombination protein Bet